VSWIVYDFARRGQIVQTKNIRAASFALGISNLPRGILMRVSILSLAILTFMLPSCADEPKKVEVKQEKNTPVAVRSINDVEDVEIVYDAAKGDALPTLITSAEELAKGIPDQASRERIAGRIDFSKEDLLLFAWTGCSGDAFTLEMEKLRTVTAVNFTLKHGITSDIRPHVYLFAITKDAKFRFQKVF
jgi:hypothetical protein